MLPNISRSKGDKTVKYGQLQELFFKNKEKCPDFGGKGPDMPILKFTIQNVVLRVSRRKNSEIFLCGACFFFELLTKCLWNSPHFTKPLLPRKMFCCVPDNMRKIFLETS